jgi:predicted nuclease with RNAse H fold
MRLVVVGVDLAGPANAAGTALAWFSYDDSKLSYVDKRIGASDADIVRTIAGLAIENHVVVGLDAPLSYNDGGGDRPSDKSLRQAIAAVGMPTGSVMPPTMPRMSSRRMRLREPSSWSGCSR